jgi:LysM repeat protein
MRSIEHPFEPSRTFPRRSIMSQSTLGTSALRVFPPAAAAAPAVPDETAETAIFERLPITPLTAFRTPRLRLVLDDHVEGGRRDAPELIASAAATSSRSGGEGWRLTRRGRVVVTLLAALIASAVVVVVFSLALRAAPAQPSTGNAASTSETAGSTSETAGSTSETAGGAMSASGRVVVQPGDTLWSIATRVAPDADPRVTVQRLIERNALSSPAIQAGEVLALPN